MMLVTVRPGPVLHIWKDGQEVAQVALSARAALTSEKSTRVDNLSALSARAALTLLADLATALRGRA
jgi:hypothetical protein